MEQFFFPSITFPLLNCVFFNRKAFLRLPISVSTYFTEMMECCTCCSYKLLMCENRLLLFGISFSRLIRPFVLWQVILTNGDQHRKFLALTIPSQLVSLLWFCYDHSEEWKILKNGCGETLKWTILKEKESCPLLAFSKIENSQVCEWLAVFLCPIHS
jgi:hypothetical protein